MASKEEDVVPASSAAPDTRGLVPFTIPEPDILETVLKYCAYEDLKSARLACRQLYECSFKVFTSRSRLHFRNFEEVNAFLAQITHALGSADHSSPDGGDVSPIQQSTFPPEICSYIRVSGLDFQNWTILLRPLLERFSANLTTFEIDHGNVSHCPSGLEVYLRELARDCPHLKTLILRGSHLSYQPREPFFHISVDLPTVKTLKVILRTPTHQKNGYRFFREILRALPKVERITCVNYPFLAIYTLDRVDLPKSLPTLHLHLPNGFGLDQFLEKGYWITNLKLNIQVSLSLVNLHTLIQSFSQSLESLQMNFAIVQGQEAYNYSHNATSFPSAPQMTSLKYLKLVGFWGSLYFLREIPKLERVEVECMQWRIAFPEGTENELMLPRRIRKILRFYDENGVYQEL